MKKTWPVLLFLLKLATPAAEGQFTYITNANTIAITGYAGTNVVVAIPSAITGLPVTSIGTNAFAGITVVSVTMPNSITNIADGAFNSCGLTNMTIPGHVLTIGAGAFAFNNLVGATIPASVTNLGQNVFIGCYTMKAITVAAGNKDYSSAGGVLFDKDKKTLLEYPNGLGGNYTVPNGVTNIAYQAFWSCGNVTSVTIPNSVITITGGAFAGCGLTNLSLGSGVTSIGLQAFEGCTSLASVTIPASVVSLGDAFNECSHLARVFFQGNAPAADATVFVNDAANATAFYLPHTTGWSSTFGGIPAVEIPAFFTITAETLPAAADAIVTGAGTYAEGSNATVSASAGECYYFTGWKAGNKIVSLENPYTFSVTNNESLTATFALSEYMISLLSYPPNWGTASGGGKIGCGGKATLRATAKAGFAFAGWTVENGPSPETQGIAITNNPYVITDVSGNATYVANFKDIEPPKITITAPVKNEKIGPAAFTIQGTARDNAGVGVVYYSLNGAAWQPALSTNDFTNWYAYVSLNPGSTNTLSAYAVDTGENDSPSESVTFTCTAAGFAPVSIAGEKSLASSANDGFEMSFGSAGYVLTDTNGGGTGEVGTYTYTPTGPDTAELVARVVLPTLDTSSDGWVIELTFTNALAASYADNFGVMGSFSFSPAEESVPATLDGAVIAQGSFKLGGPYGTNTYDSSTSTEVDSLAQHSNTSTYTFTPFTRVAALVVSAFTSPPLAIGITNYTILSFTEGTSHTAGVYLSENVYPSGPGGWDFGSFTVTSNAVTTKFIGPPTLAGLENTITPLLQTPISGSHSFLRSYGNGTYASISSTNTEPTDVGIFLANTRATANTGIVTRLALAPPYAMGTDDQIVDIDWLSSSSGTATVVGTGETAKITFSPAGNFAPAALTGHTITTTQTGTNKARLTTFTYNTYTNASGDFGTYTYAPYTPTMALVKLTPNAVFVAEGPDYVLLDFHSLTTSAYVGSETNSLGEWVFKPGTFTFK